MDNMKDLGSIPNNSTNSALVQFWLEYLTVTQVVASSSLVRTANI